MVEAKNSGGHEVLRLNGKPINWNKPPKPTTKVLWSKRTSSGKKVTGSFRTICCLNRLNNLAVDRGWKQGLVIIQPPYNSGVAASVGTHDLDAVVDCYIPGLGWWATQRFLRANGLGCWYRHPPKFGNHVHGIVLPPREGKDVSDDFKIAGFKVGRFVDGGWSTAGKHNASSQIEDYYNHAFGLAGMHGRNSDTSWFPANIASTIFNLDAYVKRRASKSSKPKPTKPKPPKEDHMGLRIDGVDISHWQSGVLDFAAAKRAGVRWVFHKATEGTSYTDPNYGKRRSEMAREGDLPFGAYHFARPAASGGRAQARHFLSVAKPKKGDMRPMLDLEDRGGKDTTALTSWVREFVDEVKKETGEPPFIYTPFDLCNHFDCPLWVARYNNANAAPRIPKPWKRYAIWQFSNGQYGVPKSVAGLGNVDLNTMNGNPEKLTGTFRLGGQPKPSAPPPPAKKSVTQIAREVIDGKWGNGDERINRLRRAGYQPKAVQKKVNSLLAPPKPKPKPKTYMVKRGDTLSAIGKRFGIAWRKLAQWSGIKNPNRIKPGQVIRLEPKPKPKPKPAAPKGRTATLKFCHISMQFSDNDKQHTHDADVVFSRGYDVISGTEAGPGAGNLSEALRAAAKRHGYRLHDPSRYDTWVAVKDSLVLSDWRTGAEFALWRSSRTTPKPPGRWGDKGVVWAQWNMGPTYGVLTIGAVHYLTHGGAGAYKTPSDKKYAKVIGEWARREGKGSNLLWVGGDFNLVDRRNDVFYGEPLTTCWDDLKRWPNTGHGNIDAIARYNRDARVTCVGARVLDDTDLPLATDHWLVEAEYEIKAR